MHAVTRQPHVIVPSIIKRPVWSVGRSAGRFGLQSDGFGKREITLLAFPLLFRLILALPSINIAWQIMGTGTMRH